MPRNPHKTRCTVSGCRAWAMRGRTRCRPHLDGELGPRCAGPPQGNLNALRHGRYSQPLTTSALERLVAEIIEHPDDIHHAIASVTQAVQARNGDAYQTLLVLRELFKQLAPLFAGHLFVAQVKAFLQSIPEAHRESVLTIIQRSTAGLTVEDRLLFLEKISQVWNDYRYRDPSSLSTSHTKQTAARP